MTLPQETSQVLYRWEWQPKREPVRKKSFSWFLVDFKTCSIFDRIGLPGNAPYSNHNREVMPKKYLPVICAVETVTGLRHNPSSLWRWSTKGCGGVVLRTWLIGGRRMTTTEEVEEFIRRRSDEPAVQPQESRTSQLLRRELGL